MPTDKEIERAILIRFADVGCGVGDTCDIDEFFPPLQQRFRGNVTDVALAMAHKEWITLPAGRIGLTALGAEKLR